MRYHVQRLHTNLLNLFFPPEQGKEEQLMPCLQILIPGGLLALLFVALAF